jgi:hypothetical protein
MKIATFSFVFSWCEKKTEVETSIFIVGQIETLDGHKQTCTNSMQQITMEPRIYVMPLRIFFLLYYY